MKDLINEYQINNVADYALNEKYIVYKQIHCNGTIERWFYGATDDRNLANKMAMEITDRENRCYGNVLSIED